MTDRNAIWRAVVDAVVAALPESAQLARTLADDVMARLSVESIERDTARAKLDAFIAAFDALGVRSADVHGVDMVDRTDHVVVIGVSSRAELAALAAELDLSELEDHNEGGYAWVEAYRRPERGMSITIQMHLPSRRTAA